MLACCLLLASCEPQARQEAAALWPEITFVVMDEIPEKFVFERTKEVVPSVDRVLLLPIVANYLHQGERKPYAIAEPMVVHPGEETLSSLFSSLSSNGQRVLRCIILARGYCPGELQPTINYAGIYQGKEAWLVEIARVSDNQYEQTYAILMNELKGDSLTLSRMPLTADIWNFDVCLARKELLRRQIIHSPVVRRHPRSPDSRSEIILWAVPEGASVSICISADGRKALERELAP